MATRIFVNLPVEDLDRSMEFFRRLGYTYDPRFTDERAACMIVGDDIHVMLLTREMFASFAPNPVADATETTEVLVGLTAASREAVDETIRNAVEAGGSAVGEPQDHGFMYGHSFQDPDGHVWEFFFMEPGALAEEESPVLDPASLEAS